MEQLIIHGGAGSLEGKIEQAQVMHDSLCKIWEESFDILQKSTAEETVCHAIRMLEDDPIFNAGTGSKLQADGQVRMSSALMDGTNNRFSGVINVQNIRNPIEAAALLSKEENTVLSGAQATEFCRKNGMDDYNPVTQERLEDYKKRCSGKHGTVGTVALDNEGHIFAGTSTGGIGYEIPGRVSDCPTVAGTYASTKAGVSCTGIGEQITQQAAAAKIVIRVEDGMPLHEAVTLTMSESNKFSYLYGLISLDSEGHVEVGKTEALDEVFYAFHDNNRIRTFFA
ncbi:MAG: isoaspartyl peptidase/L-asparaginase [SAR324 cluster bacterium]|nr:isoaspartyl peptidase/L-asparaginase [SAR324 cluster bacterium]MEC9070072.1 isoaspartyl peptidase/L-asparaginase [SAR324 cluster bacterium]MED5240712.1 isoaspartyl peptidase/L-asparaginase [SAR324 cluster bacterium]MED5516836.1 isoaspartyl peptidase/L-asparaginase [SAR324 cluster bacterium]MED6338939.1 isoaspartyl peptidase/L-asparaginase [SAR324 cluster bacterium]